MDEVSCVDCWQRGHRAAVPIAGGGEVMEAAKLTHLPIWAFHCDGDPIVPFQVGRRTVAALRAAGGNVKFTVYHEVSHDAWTTSYANPQLYDWLLAQQRGEPGPVAATEPNMATPAR